MVHRSTNKLRDYANKLGKTDIDFAKELANMKGSERESHLDEMEKIIDGQQQSEEHNS